MSVIDIKTIGKRGETHKESAKIGQSAILQP
jgi:hypothetical protein